jgi:hypothetical protein
MINRNVWLVSISFPTRLLVRGFIDDSVHGWLLVVCQNIRYNFTLFLFYIIFFSR